MSAHFVDYKSRILFIEGLIEVLSLIFSVENDIQKVALYNELTTLKDEDLLENQKMIESYLEDSLLSEKNTLQKLKITQNRFDEFDEKRTVTPPNIF
jgi:hypothetical protein